jgi:hypothetical protein
METEKAQRTSLDNMIELLCSQQANKEGIGTTMFFQLAVSVS